MAGNERLYDGLKNVPDSFNFPAIVDVLPYLAWGNSVDDPTSIWERITASYKCGKEKCE